VALKGEIKNACADLVGNPREELLLGKTGRRRDIITLG
jgi:hypothetical protein